MKQLPWSITTAGIRSLGLYGGTGSALAIAACWHVTGSEPKGLLLGITATLGIAVGSIFVRVATFALWVLFIHLKMLHIDWMKSIGKLSEEQARIETTLLLTQFYRTSDAASPSVRPTATVPRTSKLKVGRKPVAMREIPDEHNQSGEHDRAA
jgi:hypothetical protein